MFLALCLFSISFIACHKDNAPYEITFAVKNAAGTATLDGEVGEEMTFDVTFTHATQGTIHNVKVAVLDAAKKELKVLESKHAHASKTYNTKLKYTPSVAGNYFLEVSSTDDAGGAPNMTSVSFTVK